MKSAHPRRRRVLDVGLLDLLCLIIFYVVIAETVSIGVAFYRNFDAMTDLDDSIGSFNRVVYLFRASGGDLADALTPEQVVAKYQAMESDEITLTVHSILTTPFEPGRSLPSSVISRASQSFWEVESRMIHTNNAAAG